MEGREISLVLGTAGHIDHGKTTLVKALTGVDCDRLREEKKRGITIELGFAPLKLEDGRIVSIVDVPGHERFIRQMVAGASGIDAVLLVIAADEGVMPQTREAINHSKAAGVPIIVAINKIDKPDARPEKVKQELTEHGIVSSEWGGDVTMVEVSAKKRFPALIGSTATQPAKHQAAFEFRWVPHIPIAIQVTPP